MENVIPVLQVMIFVLLFIMGALVLAYFFLLRNREEAEEKTEEAIQDKKADGKKPADYGRFKGELTTEAIFDFMEFEEIVDNMIVRKKGSQHIMVLQCNGVNYDLMSEQEKLGVEEGFVQFLNTLRFPIQLYIQSRTLNLREIIAKYKERVDTVAIDLEKIDTKIIQARASGNKSVQEKLEFERKRKANVLDYGINITDYVEKLSSNRNILQQRTYVIVSYYTAELGGGLENYSKEELYNMCFSELYTRCQNVASGLGTSQIGCKILDSEELGELLYVAYNRDESELLQLSKALDAQYDALYSTGKEVLQKKQERLDKEINISAIDMATDSILKADKKKQLEDLDMQMDKQKKVKEKALELLDTYEDQLDPRVYELAKDEVKKSSEPAKTEPARTPKLSETSSENMQKRKVIRRREGGEQNV